MDWWLEATQWPAMVVTVLATWLVGSRSIARRRAGFWVFMASNVLWIAWGWHGDAYALIVLQLALIVMNLRGMREARKAGQAASHRAFNAARDSTGNAGAGPLSLSGADMRQLRGDRRQPPGSAGPDR
ncbi:hypothetical protein CTP10_R50670 [Cupriavidus sp. P-10]|uniref:hypothetical protein n=1 Tax=Cupriavidus sp. P-10 TaxID=2027911 RepID=UPI000E2F0E98|nr:hypothetical protein [Cupriavidus sp. P-10]BDB27659.1 hypothetical protein CTP10_R50670 [Cupriavidus sp. P-10]